VNVELRNVDRLLLRAEREIALLDRCRPLNARSERARLLSSWQRGEAVVARFQYAPAPDFSELRAHLLALGQQLSGGSCLARLYGERALELEAEARVAEAIGTPEIAAAGSRRYAYGEAEAEAALACTERFLKAAGTGSREDACTLHRSDDEGDPWSLISCLQRVAGQLRLPLRIELRGDLASAAATTLDGRILIRCGVEHTEREVQRIVVHEIEGHALPRLRARSEGLGLFLVGTAQGSDDEEGRALLLEARAECLGDARRRELGWRHLAAIGARGGQDFVETVRCLLERGASLERALEIGCRVFRGGGLAREVVYLTAYCRVGSALGERRELESWLERGRIGIAAAHVLEDWQRASAFEGLEVGDG
jgi:hypothetical protein